MSKTGLVVTLLRRKHNDWNTWRQHINKRFAFCLLNMSFEFDETFNISEFSF